MATGSTFSSRRGSSSPSASVICEEVFDESCQPSADEISDYAQLLGIDPVKEPHLLYLAKEGLMQALPPDWKICYSEEKCGHYYYNTKTKVSQWDHPLDAVYRDLVEQARQKFSSSAATPVVDNSDDASQIDSGIRSLQGNDDCDNTNDMSSPVNNVSSNANAKFVATSTGGGSGSNSSAINSSSTSTSGFSGGVSRFLESRSKNFGGPTFQAVKNSRFEISKTNPQIGLSMKFPNEFSSLPVAKQVVIGAAANSSKLDGDAAQEKEKAGKGFTLSGTGSMFLKSRKAMEMGLNQAAAMVTGSASVFIESSGTPPGVKSILRDSSLTDMRRRGEAKEETDSHGATALEDKKSVRFNLSDDSKLRSSPEEDPSSSRRLTQSPEVSVNSDEDDEDDPWDDDDNDVDEACANVGVASADGSFQRSLNPFLLNDEKHVKEIKVISVPKAQTIQMLKAQSFSMELPDREKGKLSEQSRSQSVEAAPSSGAGSAVSYLEKLKDNAPIVKPLYEDTDSESKGSSVRSFIINKSDHEEPAPAPAPASATAATTAVPSSNPFDLDELDRRHTRDVEQLESKLQAVAGSAGGGAEKGGLRTLKVASKLVGFLKKDSGAEPPQSSASPSPLRSQLERESEKEIEALRQRLDRERQDLTKRERELLEEQLQRDIDEIKREHEQKLKSIRHEYQLRLTSHQHELEEDADMQLEEYRAQLEEELDAKRKAVVDEHKAQMSTLQKNHSEILQDLERDLKSEEELLKKEHATRLAAMRDKLAHELELERQRLRDTGEDRLYEKVRCEKRLLEDKYRCLKDKYVRLKTDVKLSLERRNRRREAQALNQQSLHTTTTGSETERSLSNKPSMGTSENRSLSLSTSYPDHGGGGGGGCVAVGKGAKPPVPPKTHLAGVVAGSGAAPGKEHRPGRDRSAERGQGAGRKPGIPSKYIKHLQVQDDTTTSISQSDTTISNNYTKGRYLPVAPGHGHGHAVSDNGNSDSEAFQYNQENNNNSSSRTNTNTNTNTNANANANTNNTQRKKLFSRMKSASTSRLNSDNNYKGGDRPCTPVENLRHQLQKLEDLEDQFPDNTLDTTYHLRYPFSDISNDRAGTSSELEFFKHRIHLERDSVRRAKESLRTQRTNFRARQREIKLRHKASVTRHTLDQLIQEEKELTEMEVNLHRTRALLGEKVIRLRHLEQSLSRVYEKEKPPMDLLGVEQKDDATLSDLSSHSSSGFSSTDFASGADTQNINRRKDLVYHQESTECIQNLEILNAEIREILDILGKSQQHGGIPVPMISPSDLNWSHMLSSNTTTVTMAHPHGQQQPHQHQQSGHMPAPQSIPTLADRLETYRQLATGRMQTSMGGAILAANTIVSQSPRAVNYTTSLVERTRDLRNWLRQAKNEHDILTGMGGGGVATPGLAMVSTAGPSGGAGNVAGGPGGVGVVGAATTQQANL